MKAPDKIYIHTDPFGFMSGYVEGNQPPAECDVYVRKDALLEYLQSRLELYDPAYTNAGEEIQKLIDKINSL